MIVYTDCEMAKMLWPEIELNEEEKIDSNVYTLDGVVYIEPDTIWANRELGIYKRRFSVERKRELRMQITPVGESVLEGEIDESN